MKKISGYITVVFLCTLLILNPQKAIGYASEGLLLCEQIIIPSLFPFFVCSGLLVYSGFCEVLAKMFSPIMRPLFNINPTGAAAFVLGLISGYPQGAVTAGQLYEGMYLSKSEAQRLLAFCNNSGPLFILGTVGISLYHSIDAGIILYIGHILGAISTGLVFRFYKPTTFSAPTAKIDTDKKNVSQIFSMAISDSVKNILTVCASVLFCSVLSKLIMDLFTLCPPVEAGISSLMEFVSGLGKISYLSYDTVTKLLMSAAVCAFAGISVHLQVMGVVSKYGLSLKPYIFGKILHAFFAVLYTFILLKLFPVSHTVFSYAAQENSLSLGFFIASAAMLILAATITAFFIIFLILKLKHKSV